MIIFVGFFIFISVLGSPVVVTDQDDADWVLQQKNVCFGSGKDQFGEFTIKSPGLLQGFRFEYVRGDLVCNNVPVNWVSCLQNNFPVTVKGVDEENNLLVPVDVEFAAWRDYISNGYTSKNRVLMLLSPTRKYIGKQLLRVWYRYNIYRLTKNDSVACFNIFAKVIPLPAVSLELTTTACDSCNKSTKVEKCPSSIKVNNKEVSHGEDGLNVLIINPNMTMGKTVSFRGNNNVQFQEFFSSITPSSIFVIVLQNYCVSNFTTIFTWYKHLGLNANVTPSIESEYVGYKKIGVVVGCKDRCIDVVGGHIPYSYFGFGEQYTVMLTLTGKMEVKTDKVASLEIDMDIDNRTAIIVFMVTLLCIVGLIFLICICKRRRDGRDRVDKEKRTVDVALIDMQERIRTVNETGSAKTEDYGYSGYSDVTTKSVEHIYAYVDPQIVKDLMNECKPVVPTTSRQNSSHGRQREQKSAEFVDVEGSSSMYMAPSSLPKCDSPMVPQGTPQGAPSKHTESNPPIDYEVMTCYRDETFNDVTLYEEISGAAPPHRKSECDNPDTHIDMNNVSVHSTPETFNVYENASKIRLNSQQNNDSDLYMNVGAYRTYSNGSQQYVSLANGNNGNVLDVESGEPLYQRISFSNDLEEELAI